MAEEMLLLAHASVKGHPNIVQMFGICVDEIEPTAVSTEIAQFDPEASNVRLAIIVELADPTAPTLAHWMEGGRIKAEDIGVKSFLMSDIINGLSALHHVGITHGDIKPANILMFPTERRLVAKVSDFGFSDVNERSRTPAGGTDYWIAPECQVGSSTFDKRWACSPARDVYSLGRKPTEKNYGKSRENSRPEEVSKQVKGLYKLKWTSKVYQPDLFEDPDTHIFNKDAFRQLFERLNWSKTYNFPTNLISVMRLGTITPYCVKRATSEDFDSLVESFDCLTEAGEPEWNTIPGGYRSMEETVVNKPAEYAIRLQRFQLSKEFLTTRNNYKKLLPIIEAEVEALGLSRDGFLMYLICNWIAITNDDPKSEHYADRLFENLPDEVTRDIAMGLDSIRKGSAGTYLFNKAAERNIGAEYILNTITEERLHIPVGGITRALKLACESAVSPELAYNNILETLVSRYIVDERIRFCRDMIPGSASRVTRDLSPTVKNLTKMIDEAFSSDDIKKSIMVRECLEMERGRVSKDDIAYITLYAAEECGRRDFPNTRLLGLMIGVVIEDRLNNPAIMKLALESHIVQSHDGIRALFLGDLDDWSLILRPEVLGLAIIYDIYEPSLLLWLRESISIGAWRLGNQDSKVLSRVLSSPMEVPEPYILRVSIPETEYFATKFPLLHISIMVDTLDSVGPILDTIEPEDVNTLASGSLHPLHLAALKRNPIVMNRLLTLGPEYEIDPDIRVKGPSLGYTSLHLLTWPAPMHLKNGLMVHSDEYIDFKKGQEVQAQKYLRLACIHMFLQYTKDADARDWHGKSPLLSYIENGDLDGIKVLISCDRINLRMRDFAGNSALHFAVRSEDVSVLQFCLEHPVFCELINEKNNAGITPLALASGAGLLALASELIKAGANLLCKDIFGCSILQAAVGMGGPGGGIQFFYNIFHLQEQGVAISHENIQDLCRVTDKSGRNIMHYACSYIEPPNYRPIEDFSEELHVFVDMVLEMLDKDLALLISSDNGGLIPVDLAAYFGHMDLVDKFVTEYDLGLSYGIATLCDLIIDLSGDDIPNAISQHKAIQAFVSRYHNTGLFNFLYVKLREFEAGNGTAEILLAGSIAIISSGYPEIMESVYQMEELSRMEVPEFSGIEGETDYGPTWMELRDATQPAPERVTQVE
ncbi:Ankyrin-3 [Dactylella cylindrospora]|nr:Ankyrin-3 [Dactylella cylindrospora]